MTDRHHLLKTLAGVYAYYDRELSEVTAAVWIADLDGYEPAAIDAAFVRHRRDPERGQWMPKTADILCHLQGDAQEKRQTAWAGVLSEARRVGNYGNPNLTAEQQSAVDACGGWRAICHCDEKELGFMQRRFMEAFDAFDARAERALAIAAPEVRKLLEGAFRG